MDNVYASDLLEVYKDPVHRGKLNTPEVAVDQHNPFCGDRVYLDLQVVDGVIQNAKFDGDMCFVSVVGAEFLLEAIIGKTITDAKAMDQAAMLALLDLNLSTSRIACATLTLKALHTAIAQYERDTL